jgi:predicted nucleic acid-binding protein
MELSQQARKAKLRTPSLFDALTLATARLLKAKVLTGDEHFRSQLETIWIGS